MTRDSAERSFPLASITARLRRAAALTLPLLLAACLGGGGPSLDIYDLSAANPPLQRPLRAQLRIAEPTAAVDLDSDRIVVRTPQELEALSGAKWPDRLPALLRSRLTQSFENAGLMQGGPAPSADYELELDIRKFELVVARKRIEIDIAAKIVSASGSVAAVQVFTAEAPVASEAPADVSAAMNGALSAMMTRIVAFAAARL